MPKKRVEKVLGEYVGRVTIKSFAEKNKAGIDIEVQDTMKNVEPGTDLREEFIEAMEEEE